MSHPAEPARIISDADIGERPLWGRLVATSGGFDPIHPGHLSSIAAAAALGDTLVVIVNGDSFLTSKKGRPFQDLATRCAIVSYVRGVDLVYGFEIEDDPTVNVALERLRPDVFAKGGDRTDASNIAEWQTCQRLGIEIVTGVGLDKEWASSDLLAAWGRWYASRPST